MNLPRPIYGDLGKAYSYQVVASDVDGGPLTFAATGLPTGLSISPTGLITGTPTAEGIFEGRVTVTDSGGLSTSEPAEYIIWSPPEITPPGPQTGTVGQPFSLQIVATDATSVMAYLAGDLPDGVRIGRRTGLIEGVPTTPGSGTAQVTAVDSNNAPATVSFSWTILPGKPPGAPQAVTVVGGARSAVVSWQPPVPAADRPQVDSYVVTVTPGPRTTVSGSQTSTTLSSLTPGVTYAIDVRAANAATGAGDPASVTLVGTAASVTKPAAVVKYGDAAKVAGRLTQVGTGAGVVGVPVRLESMPAGATAWSPVATLTTGERGAWARSVRPEVTTRYRVVFDGAVGLLGGESSARAFAVRYVVSAKAGDTTPAAKQRISIKGSVQPVQIGTPVILQRLAGSTWVKLAATTTKANGSYAVSASFKKGTTKIRVLVPATAEHAQGVSRRITIKAH
ncbi:MAG TPA: putative Ig domain-containing protein [Actinoplanes sp.]|nr:putative Ig domain-containing protein [Actinoplanes sp.]